MEYKDFPMEQNEFATRVSKFTRFLKDMQARVALMRPTGGGDAPECVCSQPLDFVY